jgi:hypothetical protein
MNFFGSNITADFVTYNSEKNSAGELKFRSLFFGVLTAIIGFLKESFSGGKAKPVLVPIKVQNQGPKTKLANKDKN